MPITINDKVFEKVTFTLENDFEKVVIELSDKIFGENTIYIDVKKKLKGNNIGVIPDGYLIDMTIVEEPKLYIIENELVNHHPYKHIGIQMLTFVTSFDDDRLKLRNIIMNEISKHPNHMKRLLHCCQQSSSRNIDSYLDQAVYSEFKGLVIIDDAKPELNQVLKRIAANISVLEIKTYQSIEGDFAYEYDTLYGTDEDMVHSIKKRAKKDTLESRNKRRLRRAACDTVVVAAREDGFKKEFLGNHCWFSIRIGAAMKDRIKYLATYQVAPVSAVTYIAEVKEIKPYEDSGKYILFFKGPPKKIKAKKMKDPNKSPQGPVYVKYVDLMKSKYLDEAMD